MPDWNLKSDLLFFVPSKTTSESRNIFTNIQYHVMQLCRYTNIIDFCCCKNPYNQLNIIDLIYLQNSKQKNSKTKRKDLFYFSIITYRGKKSNNKELSFSIFSNNQYKFKLLIMIMFYFKLLFFLLSNVIYSLCF